MNWHIDINIDMDNNFIKIGKESSLNPRRCDEMAKPRSLNSREQQEELFRKLDEDIDRRAKPCLEAVKSERIRNFLEAHRQGAWHAPIG